MYIYNYIYLYVYISWPRYIWSWYVSALLHPTRPGNEWGCWGSLSLTDIAWLARICHKGPFSVWARHKSKTKKPINSKPRNQEYKYFKTKKLRAQTIQNNSCFIGRGNPRDAADPPYQE